MWIRKTTQNFVKFYENNVVIIKLVTTTNSNIFFVALGKKERCFKFVVCIYIGVCVSDCLSSYSIMSYIQDNASARNLQNVSNYLFQVWNIVLHVTEHCQIFSYEFI